MRTKVKMKKLDKKKSFNKKEFIYWAKKTREIIERVAQEREKYEKSSSPYSSF